MRICEMMNDLMDCKRVYSADGIKLKARHITAIPQGGTGSSSSSTNYVMSKDSTDYIGDFVYHNNKFSRYNWGDGYVLPLGGTSYAYRFYIRDHQGNNRVVTTSTGTVKQTTHYYPDGVTHDKSTEQGLQRYKYNGKELDRMHGLDWYDYGAREYDPTTGMFTSMDPLCEKYYHISPYAYCAGNPVRYVDPDGRETHVTMNSNGTYRVIGGILNKDRNIYVYSMDKDGSWTIRGKSIGVTSSTTSFYNSDADNGNGAWAIGAIIDPKNNSGRDFLNKMVSMEVTLNDYMDKARNDHPYDFKVTNGGETVRSKALTYQYRGMSIGKTTSGETIYTSARDIGNMAAGIVAAKNGIPWNSARLAFDAYQSRHGFQVEGLSTRNAEYYGWSQMYRYTSGITEAVHLRNTVHSFFEKLLNKIF